MKNTLPLLSALLLAACAASCTKETDATSNFTIFCCNLVTPADESLPSTASDAQYVLNFNHTQQTLALGAQNLEVDGAVYTFASTAMPYKTGTYSTSVSGNYYTLTSFQGGSATASASGAVPLDISGISGYATDNFIIFVMSDPGIGYSTISQMLVLGYDVSGGCKVRTFPRDAFYSGTAKLDSGEDTSVGVRLVVYPSQGKASVLLYSLSAATDASSRHLMLKDIPFTCVHGGYEVNASDIVPYRWNGSVWALSEADKVSSLSLESVGESLLSIKMNCTFAEGAGLSFTGSYLAN